MQFPDTAGRKYHNSCTVVQILYPAARRFLVLRKRAFSRPQITAMLQISIVATLPSNFARFDR
jgi:hypothetical protein